MGWVSSIMWKQRSLTTEAFSRAATTLGSNRPPLSLNEHGSFCSGPYGSGEFIVTTALLILANGVWAFKLIKFCAYPDRAELARRVDEVSMALKKQQSVSAIADLQK